MLHLVLDHSALYPCGDKPQEEKSAIVSIIQILPRIDSIWYMTRNYLKTLFNIIRKNCSDFENFQSFYLIRKLRNLQEKGLGKSRHAFCKSRNISNNDRLRIHVLYSSAFNHLPKNIKYH